MTSRRTSQDPQGLLRLKDQLRSIYLGKYGIHAIGVRHDTDAICVYVTPGVIHQDEALRQLRKDAHPHALVVVMEPPAQADERE